MIMLNQLLLIELEEASETYQEDGQIVQPDQFKDKPTKGRILEIGEGCENKELQKGQIIIFPNHIGQQYKKGQKIMHERDIWGIEEESFPVEVREKMDA